MAASVALRNRIGFILLGLTNNFAYVIMLSAAYDLLKQSEIPATGAISNNSTSTLSNATEKYCNEHSTSTILLADTIPSLITKLMYPVFLLNIPVAYKASATAVLSAASFLITGMTTNQVLIFAGVAFASFSSGLGESTYLSNTPSYGDVALSGWSIGTGGAGLLGAAAYALLSMVLPIKVIMILMLVAPVTMLVAYFYMLKAVDTIEEGGNMPVATISVMIEGSEDELNRVIGGDTPTTRDYGANNGVIRYDQSIDSLTQGQLIQEEKFDKWAKIQYLPKLARYFLPLLLVYFAEYFINQGLFELIYYPQVTFLAHQAQYRWFQVAYQLGVMISRSSLDLIQIRQLWTMSILQAVNAALFLAHASKLIHIPSFYIVLALIVYEGLLGGFTYANTFFRMRKELPPKKHEFGVSTVTIADTLGIVFAGMAALPVHNELCKLYQ